LKFNNEETRTMTPLSARNQVYVGLALAALMLTTRSHHFASVHHLPDASWAVFFLAGVWLRPAWTFPVLLAGAAATDYVAITVFGVSSFCVTPAYVMLLPAYGALWLAGRWFAGRGHEGWSALAPLAAAVTLSATVAELLSSGGFYFLGGRFADPTLAEFGGRFATYFPHNLLTMALYVGVAGVVYVAILLAGSRGAGVSVRQ
jgi:hypothetical protein